MKKRKSKIPTVSYEYVQENEQGRHLDLAFNILFEEVMKQKKIKKGPAISSYQISVVPL